jgi:hypothetical protein
MCLTANKVDMAEALSSGSELGYSGGLSLRQIETDTGDNNWWGVFMS